MNRKSLVSVHLPLAVFLSAVVAAPDMPLKPVALLLVFGVPYLNWYLSVS